jgi:photosystem I subunit 10
VRAAYVQIMIASTTAFLAAGKFGLAPTVKNGTNAACKLQPRANAAGLITNDPSGASRQQ